MENANNQKIEEYLDKLEVKERTNLLPSLLKAQELFGYIPEDIALKIGKILKVAPADIYGVIEFYSLLYSKPTAETVIRVCTSPLCSLKGSEKIKKALLGKLNLEEGIPSSDRRFMVETVQCLGLCDHAPAAMVNNSTLCDLSIESIDDLIEGNKSVLDNKTYGNNPVLTERFDKIDPASIDDFIKEGGFTGFLHALILSRKDLIELVKSSGLLGRGGAAFPTGLKEEGAVQAENSESYVVCNADESEPGTFKDRVMLSKDPFSVLEGMLISAYIIGAKYGYIYIRGEYQDAQILFAKVIEKAKSNGFLGSNIKDSDFSFELEIRSGAGAYICGEETALFESIEGKRGYPRNKPPYPVVSGLFGKPTNINNVETFSYLARILSDKKKMISNPGLASPSGSRLFCLSGDVVRPGLYELPFGVKLNEVIEDWGGGIPDGKQMKTIILGGASGSFVPEEHWEIALDQKTLRAAGLSMGSGVIMVFDATRDVREILVDITNFFNHESCGKCYPCQLGTRKQQEIIGRINKTGPKTGDFNRLEDVGLTMKDASLCGLGQTASSAVLSALTIWPELFKNQEELGVE
ncbi:MAG: NAD(P)H-dependent oxidoreductase subunit E [Spirochaetia bacterium]|jgi:NADH-quinone oxidoreductase subunit F|nr:NAD(P)H-dependent oxidoreductase subunit E [Spirochaetia bacterium]